MIDEPSSRPRRNGQGRHGRPGRLQQHTHRRVHPAILLQDHGEYYGTQTPLDQLASFHVPRAAHDDGEAARQELH